jgi:hypothetical protein
LKKEMEEKIEKEKNMRKIMEEKMNEEAKKR